MQPFKHRPRLNAGKLNRRIAFQTFVDGRRDDAGFPLPPEWVTQFTLSAAREPIRGREYFAAAAAQAENTVRYKVRYDKRIAPSMRIMDGDRIYNIEAVLDDVYGDRTETHIMTTENVTPPVTP